MTHAAAALHFPQATRRLPLPLLLEPLAMDAALQRLVQPARAALPVAEAGEGDWAWIDSGFDALEVTEHTLPEGVDLADFHALMASC